MKKLWQRIGGDVMGGATAAIVALPLALAFGIASGAGALAGLYGAIFGGLVAALLGGCGVQITGPTGAMTAILVSIVGQYGLGGMLLATALAGLMQVLLGLLRLGKFVKYLPQPVIAGFTNGIAILFFKTAVGDAVQMLPITIITTIVIVITLRFFKKVPSSLFGLAAGLIVNELVFRSAHIVGDIAFRLPQLMVNTMPFAQTGALIMPAFTICLLGSISALLSAEVTDEMIGVRHNSNKELIGQGLGNIAAALIGGTPVTGAVARSGVNIHSGGRTRLSSVLHSVFLLLMIVFLGPIVRRIPMASLAAILMVASVRTVDWKSLKLMPKARWSYGAIMIITTVLTAVKDLTVAVAVGVLLAGLAALVESASFPKFKKGGRSSPNDSVFPEHPAIKILSLKGPLYFTGAERLRRELQEGFNEPVLILDFSNVSAIDESGALALQKSVQELQKQGQSVYMGGLDKKPLRMLLRMKVVENLGRSQVCRKMESALKRAFEEIDEYIPEAKVSNL